MHNIARLETVAELVLEIHRDRLRAAPRGIGKCARRHLSGLRCSYLALLWRQ